MVEKTKKTTTSESQKGKKVLVKKPKATEENSRKRVRQKSPITVEKSSDSSSCNGNCACNKKDCFRVLIIGLLVINLVIGIWMMIKIIHLQNWIIMGSGGDANLQRLEAIYATPEYQEHFKNEIDTLENQIKIMNPKAE